MKSVPLCAVAAAAVSALACTGQVDRPRTDWGPGTGGGGGTTMTGGSGGTGMDPKPPAVPACAQEGLPSARLWRLTHVQFRNTLADVFGFTPTAASGLPADSRLEGFANDADRLAVSSLLTEYYYKAADELAGDVIRRSADFLACPLAQLGTGTCLGDFIATYAARAWRRPVSDGEVAKLRAVYTTAATATDPGNGLRMLVQAMVLSPHFLFRSELGPADAPAGKVTALTAHELASALSYTLWDAPPDAPLLALAAAGKLHQPATLVAEARRMLASPRKSSAALGSFVQQWLKVDDLLDIQKDTMAFPGYSTQVAQDLLEENRLFVDSVVFASDGDRSLNTLLTAPIGFLNSRTARLYGTTSTATQLARTDLDASQRRGLLTQAVFMAAHADGDSTRLVDRGRFIREEVLCLDVPKPPAQFMFNDPKITEDMTAREKLTVHAANPACASCHALFDAIGFAMESYDPVGQYRTMEKGKKIDTTGTIPLPGGRELKFANFVELIDQIARLPEPYDCFTSRYLEYATGRTGVAECERAPLAKLFKDSGYKVDALVLAVVGSPGFIARKN